MLGLTGIRTGFIVISRAVAGCLRLAGVGAGLIVISHGASGIFAATTDKRACFVVIPSITLGICLYTADVTTGGTIKPIGRCLHGDKSRHNKKQNEGRSFHITPLIAQIQAKCKEGLAWWAFFC